MTPELRAVYDQQPPFHWDQVETDVALILVPTKESMNGFYQGRWNPLTDSAHGCGVWLSSDKKCIYEGHFVNGQRQG